MYSCLKSSTKTDWENNSLWAMNQIICLPTQLFPPLLLLKGATHAETIYIPHTCISRSYHSKDLSNAPKLVGASASLSEDIKDPVSKMLCSIQSNKKLTKIRNPAILSVTSSEPFRTELTLLFWEVLLRR
jgi:hypothetical protein